MYSNITNQNKGGKISKGIKMNVVKKDIKHENYKDVLLNNRQLYHRMKTIRSERQIKSKAMK